MIANKYLLIAFAVFASLAFLSCDDEPSVSVIQTEEEEEEVEEPDGGDEAEAVVYGLTVELEAGGEFTFLVDVTDFEAFNPEEHSIIITGAPFGWTEPGTVEDQVMVQIENDQMPEPSGIVVEGGEAEYKYFSDAIAAGWDGGEWEGDPNRVTTVAEGEVQEDVFGVEP
ncbi:MAG: hypothetical protein GVY08_12670 [Bacteroidetes bacterium]|jgi:hypothetical protein|nr:hypothetical protein [Bacteroidota bacterium]